MSAHTLWAARRLDSGAAAQHGGSEASSSAGGACRPTSLSPAGEGGPRVFKNALPDCARGGMG